MFFSQCFLYILILYQAIVYFTNPEEEAISKDCWERKKNAGNQYFLLFQQCFLPYLKKNHFSYTFICFLQMLSIWSSPKICPLTELKIFLAHLSTTCSRGAFRVTGCPSCVIRRASSTIL